MTAPDGATEQAVLVEACRKSAIMPYDVDAVECHSCGKFFHDAVEVASIGNALRKGTMEEMLTLGSVKSNLGHGVEASGLVSFMKSLHTVQYGAMPPNLHLRQINPYLDISEAPLLLPSETVEHRSQATYVGVSAHGFGGTSVHVQLYGSVDEEIRRPPEATPAEFRPKLTYWPAGGGDLGVENRPRRGFFITGTWSSWQPEPMSDEGDGSHGYTVTLGASGWEQFQILIDGSKDKVLHPGILQAPKGTEVFGPNSINEVDPECAWLLDGTGGAWRRRGELALAADGTLVEASSIDWPYAAADRGQPGDKYHIRLLVAGKWRTVTWSKVQEH